MQEPGDVSDNQSPPTATPDTEPAAFDDLPPGNHPLEVAARRGFGPLSNAIEDAWHGHAVPCVSCGHLVYREDTECEHCGQDLSEEMLEKMRAHAGPWYVLEHVRPFPGVSLERIVRQIKRGVLTQTSIVRGPATQHQWRFAVETPGLCRYFNRCWHCHEEITPEQHYCPACLCNLDSDERISAARVPPPPPSPDSTVPAIAHAAPSDGAGSPRVAIPTPAARAASSELVELSQAVGTADVTRRESTVDTVPRVGRIPVIWIATLLVLTVIVVIVAIAHLRRAEGQTPPERNAALIAPAASSNT